MITREWVRFYNAYRRRVIYEVPAKLLPGAPIVLCLHGRYGDGQQVRQQADLSRHVERCGLVAVYPDGLWRSWNAGPGSGDAKLNNVDDVGFLRQFVADLRSALKLRGGSVYAIGFSNGSMMAYRLACEGRGLLSGVCGIAATQSWDWKTKPVIRSLHIHGAKDRIQPPEGGPAPDGYTAWSVAEHAAWWDRVVGDSSALVTVDDGGHTWPGAGIEPDTNVPLGPKSAWDATAYALEFLGVP